MNNLSENIEETLGLVLKLWNVYFGARSGWSPNYSCADVWQAPLRQSVAGAWELPQASVGHHAPASMLSARVLRTLSEAAYVFLVIVTIVATGLSCAAILSQAVRTSPTESWDRNFNALIVGASYVVLVRLFRSALAENMY